MLWHLLHFGGSLNLAVIFVLSLDTDELPSWIEPYFVYNFADLRRKMIGEHSVPMVVIDLLNHAYVVFAILDMV